MEGSPRVIERLSNPKFHRFVTPSPPGCYKTGLMGLPGDKNVPPNNSTMKSSIQKSLLALSRRAAGFTAVTAMLLAPMGSTFADSQFTGLERLRHIIVIYQENWSFDSLYGQFPGASGYAYSFDTLPQVDLKASPPYSSLVYKTPPPLLNGANDPQFPVSPDGNLA